MNLDLLQIKLKWDFLEVPDSLLVFNPFLLARLPVLMETLACATFFFFFLRNHPVLFEGKRKREGIKLDISC